MGRRVRVALITLILMATSSATIPALQAEELKFGITRILGERRMQPEFEPLMTYLANVTGRTVSLYIANDDSDLRTQMDAGVVDVGRFSPFGYVDAVRGGKIRVIAQSLLEDSPTYRGLIITRFDSDIHSLADLEGKRFAFVDRESPAGYIYPRAMLIESGFNPERSFKETIFAGSHDNVITAVLLGSAHAGAVYDGAVALATAKGLPTFDLEVLGMTDPIPHDAIAVRAGLEGTLVELIQAALVGLVNSPAGRQVIGRGQNKATGYVAADDRRYDVVRRTSRIGGR